MDFLHCAIKQKCRSCKSSTNWETISFFGMAFLYWIFFVSATWSWMGLFISCTYFFPFQYRPFSWIWGILFVSAKKYRNGFIFFDRIYVLNFFLFQLLSHGFDNRGLFIICTFFIPFHYRLSSWVYGILFASVYKYKEGSILFDGFLYWIFFDSTTWS